MGDNTKRPLRDRLPVKMKLNTVFISTTILLILMISVSVTGILFQSKLYPDKESSVQFVSNDILNLILCVPLIIAMLLTIRGRLTGLLCYPGALFYITYIYTAYLIGLPANILFMPYLILVTLSIYANIRLIASIDSDQVIRILKGYVPIRATGFIIITIAGMVLIYQTYSIVVTLINNLKVDQLTIAQWIDDVLIASPPALIFSLLMIRRKSLGYATGISLLLLFSMLFIGVVPVIIVENFLLNTPIDVSGIVIVLTSGMVCFIPFLVFLRGIQKASKNSASEMGVLTCII